MHLPELSHFTTWLHQHPHWAGFITFLIATGESLALVGLLVPGSVLMTTIGALIGAGVIPLWETFIWAVIGAILGDGLSFWAGYHYHQHIKEMWPFRRYPSMITNGEIFFQRHGGLSVFFGRFIGPIRPFVPLVAGMMNLKPSRFIIVNVISAFFWAPAYLLPGMVVGAASLQLAPDTAKRLIIFMLIFLLFFSSIAWIMRRILHCVLLIINKWLDKLWRAMRIHRLWRPLTLALQDPRYPKGHGQLTMGILWVIFSIAFGVITLSIYHHGTITSLNDAIYHFFQSFRYHELDKIIVGITLLADKIVVAGLVMGTLLSLIIMREWRAAFYWLANSVVTYFAIISVKQIVRSPRPGGMSTLLGNYSFPSGHTTLAIAIFSFFVVLIAKRIQKHNRPFAYIPVAFFAIIIALTRLYLGAHWLSDIIGSALLGVSIILFFTIAYHRKPAAEIKLPKFLIISSLCYLISWAVFFNLHINHYIQTYTHRQEIKTISLNAWWKKPVADLPLIRNDRLGHPEQILNIQWADHLDNIIHSLSEKGWQVKPKPTVIRTINRLAAKHTEPQLPLLPFVFNDQKPQLIMTKTLPKRHELLVLRLWSSQFIFSDSKLPLWVGTVNFTVLQKNLFFLHKNDISQPSAANAQTLLIADLANNEWKIKHYPLPKALLQKMKVNQVSILLIKS